MKSIGRPFRNLMQRIHRDERGAVSLETILIIGAIAIPILIFLVRVAWPKIEDIFMQNVDELEDSSNMVKDDDML